MLRAEIPSRPCSFPQNADLGGQGREQGSGGPGEEKAEDQGRPAGPVH